MAGLSLSLALAVAVVGWLVLRDDTYVAPSPRTPSAAVEPGEAAAVLQRFERAVRAGDADAAAALAPADDAAAADLLRAVVDNAAAIGVDRFTLRYVDAVGGVDQDGRWTAVVETTWRFPGFDRVASAADVEFDLRSETDGTTTLAGIGGSSTISPVWLTGPVRVVRGPRALVVAADDPGRYARLARAAVPVVRRVLPAWRAGLVVEVPRSGEELDDALGAEPGQYAAIAAVTSGVGDDLAPGVPIHVLVNPDVFASLDGRGARVVMSHEAVHVATEAATEPDVVPTWLTEGYADYVALRDVDLPLSVTAAQVARQVRREGLPARLPGDRRFDTRTTHLGAAYEAAWLACVLLAERSGEQALTDFYAGLEAGDDVDAEFRRAFGLSVAAFTRRWRQALSDLPA
ncbi:hypothetical protein [Nocardioides sp. GXQ0305]|uniref:hypothetical protein n=1 Tax=Nocardioides sp. GXQ0305 TaxID=3423912 RepID=UPI003D7DB4A7